MSVVLFFKKKPELLSFSLFSLFFLQNINVLFYKSCFITRSESHIFSRHSEELDRLRRRVNSTICRVQYPKTFRGPALKHTRCNTCFPPPTTGFGQVYDKMQPSGRPCLASFLGKDGLNVGCARSFLSCLKDKMHKKCKSAPQFYYLP